MARKTRLPGCHSLFLISEKEKKDRFRAYAGYYCAYAGCHPVDIHLPSSCPPASSCDPVVNNYPSSSHPVDIKLPSSCPPVALQLPSSCHPVDLQFPSSCHSVAVQLTSSCQNYPSSTHPVDIQLPSSCLPVAIQLLSTCLQVANYLPYSCHSVTTYRKVTYKARLPSLKNLKI